MIYIRVYIFIKDSNKKGDIMPAKLIRKVLRSGDSKAVTLPPDWARIFSINIGDAVDLLYDTIVIIKPRGIKLDPDFLLKEFELILSLERGNKDA